MEKTHSWWLVQVQCISCQRQYILIFIWFIQCSCLELFMKPLFVHPNCKEWPGVSSLDAKLRFVASGVETSAGRVLFLQRTLFWQSHFFFSQFFFILEQITLTNSSLNMKETKVLLSYMWTKFIRYWNDLLSSLHSIAHFSSLTILSPPPPPLQPLADSKSFLTQGPIENAFVCQTWLIWLGTWLDIINMTKEHCSFKSKQPYNFNVLYKLWHYYSPGN